jgi:acyl-coenzyme A synthetase/AMP-(fatty) acid ligase
MMLAELISKQKITIWYSTPTILNLIATYGKAERYNYDQLKTVLFAGEVYPPSRFQMLNKLWPDVQYYNLYGPTETNVCTCHKLTEADRSGNTKDFPIGKTCSHFASEISTENELLVSGKGLMTGYWNIESDALIKRQNNTFWYNTGDLVTVNGSGDMVFKGRKDRMIKRHGYRIEPAEIENIILTHPGITECSLISSPGEDSQHLTAFVCFKDAKDFSYIGMKEFCVKRLPSYMIPDNFINLESIPQTSTNKTDYQRLKELL